MANSSDVTLPYICCKNPVCKSAVEKWPIPSPYPSQPRMSQRPSQWPADYFDERLGCLECGLVSSYKKPDIHWLESQTQDQDQDQKSRYSNVAWWSVEFQCARQNCGTQVQFHVPTIGEAETGDVLFQLASGFYLGSCKNGHPYRSRGTGPYNIQPVLELAGSRNLLPPPPRALDLESVPFKINPVSRRQIRELAELEVIPKAANIIFDLSHRCRQDMACLRPAAQSSLRTDQHLFGSIAESVSKPARIKPRSEMR
jgi:hypothetical protein